MNSTDRTVAQKTGSRPELAVLTKQLPFFQSLAPDVLTFTYSIANSKGRSGLAYIGMRPTPWPCALSTSRHIRYALSRYYSSDNKPVKPPGPPKPDPNLESDALNILDAFRSSQEWRFRRDDLRIRLDKVVQSIDKDYSVRSIGMDAYGLDMQDGSPFEFAVERKGAKTRNSGHDPLLQTSVLARVLNQKWAKVAILKSLPEPWQTDLVSQRYPNSVRIEDEQHMTTVMLPSPHTSSRLRVLQGIYEAETHKQLLAFASLWIRSLKMDSISPTVLAFLTGCFLHEKAIPKLQSCPEEGFNLIKFFSEFLVFAYELMLREPRVISVSKKEPYYKKLGDFDDRDPRSMVDCPFVIQDPFVPSKNHVYTIPQEDWQRLFFLARVTSRGLVMGRPLASFFGPELNPRNINREIYPVTNLGSWGKIISKFPPSTTVGETSMTDADGALLEDLLVIPAEVKANREKTLEKVRKAVRSKYKWVDVKLFGSVCYGTASNHGDLDLTICDPQLPHGHTVRFIGPKYPLYRLPNLRTLMIEKGFTDVSMVGSATVPIVKFKDPETNLHCDININEMLGLYNTNLITDYCDVFPPLRKMLRFLKEWAKPLGLNKPSPLAGEPTTFSSYALALMTIGLLQRRGLLPNFQALIKPNPMFANRRRSRSAGQEPQGTFWSKKPLLLCDVRWIRTPSIVKEFPPTRELLLDWFKFYGQEFDYQHDLIRFQPEHVIGQSWGDFNTNNKRHISQCIRIQDPFNIDKNVTKHVGVKALKFFTKECSQAFERLEAGGNLASLITPTGENPLRDPTKGIKMGKKKRQLMKLRMLESAQNTS